MCYQNPMLQKWKQSHVAAMTLALFIGFIWSSLLFYTVYPYPSRWGSDDMQYLLIARNIARYGEPHLTAVSELHGGDIENMIRLGKPSPQYKGVLGYHFPAYSYFLAPFLLLTGTNFGAVYLAHLVLFLGIVGLTYYFAFRLSKLRSIGLAAATAVSFSPTLSFYLSISMMEIFVVFLAMLTLFAALRPVTAKNNLFTAVILSLLVVSRSSFIVMIVPIFLYRFSKKSRVHVATSGLIAALPLLVMMTLGKQGFLFFHEGHHPNTWEDVVSTTMENWRFVTGYQFAFKGHALYEFYYYVGILALILVAGLFWKRRLYRIVAFTHLVILTAVFFRYDWFDWRHIRVAMWLIPFTYVFSFSALAISKNKIVKAAGIGVLLLLGGTAVQANRLLLLETLPQSRQEMDAAYARAEAVKKHLDDNHAEASFVLVPREYMQVTLLDSDRIYYTVWPKSVQKAIPRMLELGFHFDAAFAMEEEHRILSAAAYEVTEESFNGLKVMVYGNQD